MSKLYPYTPLTRAEAMIEKYGECCRPKDAAHILGRSPATITAMKQDGRLEPVCGGKMISVASIARYMDAPANADFYARRRKERNPLPLKYLIPPTPRRKEA